MTSTALPMPVAKAQRKAEKALADARKHAKAARGFQHAAEVAQGAAKAARTRAEADEAADQAAADAKGAAEAVKDCKRALQRAQRARTECRKAVEAVEDDAPCASEADSAFERAKDAVETAREALGTAEEAAEAAQEAAETARETADDECMKCGEWLCACREIMCAMLARYGKGTARTVDAEAVHIGELIMSDDEELYAAGQLMLAEDWEAAEEALAAAEETQEAAEERRARVAEAEVTERTLVERYEGRTAREWADVADRHAERATEAYETAREVVQEVNRGGRSLLTDEERAQMRAAYRRIERRSCTAHTCDCRARWFDYGAEDVEEVTPDRAAQWADRARVLADACEADARLVAELYAWPDAEERAAEEIRRAEYSLADAEERYAAARRPGMFTDPVGRRIGETSALRLVWIARQALAAVNGSPYVAYPEMTDRGTVKRWYVGHCTVHPYTGTAVRIVDSSPDQDRAEAIADAKNQEHQEQQRAAAEEARQVTEALIAGAPAAGRPASAPQRPALPQGLDADTSKKGWTPAGEGGFSPELDAYSSKGCGGAAPVDVVSDPGSADTWEAEGGAVPGVESPAVVAPAATLPESEHADTVADETVSDHPALVECQAAADLLTAYADEHPDDEQADEWAFAAAERVAECAWAIEEGDEERARECARAAKGERAAVTLGRLDEAGPMTSERLAALDAETLALLQWYAGPWPVRWLWPPETDEAGRVIRPRVINLFHGPGGWSVGIRDVLGADVDMVGVDLDRGAVATAQAAGFHVIYADVTDLDPECPALQWVSGVILSPPCQAYSPAGLRMGRYASAIELIVSVVHGVGAGAGFLSWDGSPTGYAPRSGETWDEIRAPLAALDDPRAGLMAEVVIWPLAMLTRGGSVEWVAVEQSSALPQEIESALFAEFVQAGWGTVEAETLDAVDYGAASHRKRRFMAAYRNVSPFVDARPAAPLPEVTFAECVGWEPGRSVNTRGQRKINPETGRVKGGGTFSADKPSICVTATAYGWKDAESGKQIEQRDIGRLVGFRDDYPWQHVGRGKGIRNRAQQAADAVCPMVAAAVIGRVLGVEEWETRTRAYVRELYRLDAPEALPDVPAPAPALVVTLPRQRGALVAAPVRATLTAASPAPAVLREVHPSAGPAATAGGHLSRRAHTGGSRGVLAGHSTRQGATRQAARQGTRQPNRGPGRALLTDGGGRAPPSSPRPRAGRGRRRRFSGT